MTLIKLTDERLGETEIVKTPDGIEAVYSSRVRSLVDAVYDWSRFNSLPRGYDWIRAELARDPGMAEEIVRVALRYAKREHAPPPRKAAGTGRRGGVPPAQAGAKAHAVFRPDTLGADFAEAGHGGSAMGSSRQL